MLQQDQTPVRETGMRIFRQLSSVLTSLETMIELRPAQDERFSLAKERMLIRALRQLSVNIGTDRELLAGLNYWEVWNSTVDATQPFSLRLISNNGYCPVGRTYFGRVHFFLQEKNTLQLVRTIPAKVITDICCRATVDSVRNALQYLAIYGLSIRQ